MATYLYARVSTDKQENGKEAQVQRLREFALGRGYTADRELIDEDVSAFYTPLFERPQGKLLWDALAPGDTVLMTKVDRGFRSWADAANTHAKLRDLGVALRFADLDIDLSTPQGELFFSQIVAFAQFESRMHGQRKREVFAHKRKTGQPYSWIRPFGWRRVKDKKGKLSGYAPDHKEQTLGRKVLDMRSQGMSWWQIARDVCLSGARKPAAREGDGYYHVRCIRSLASAAGAGYPTVPQGFWQAPDYAQKLHAMKSDGFRLWPEGYDPAETDHVPAPRPRPGLQSPERDSPATPQSAKDQRPLAG